MKQDLKHFLIGLLRLPLMLLLSPIAVISMLISALIGLGGGDRFDNSFSKIVDKLTLI